LGRIFGRAESLSDRPQVMSLKETQDDRISIAIAQCTDGVVNDGNNLCP
jgi:hypothetical protein